MSAYTSPIVVGAEDSITVLERLPLSAGSNDLFTEKWLQNAIFRAPGCLPVREIDPHIGELIPICQEIETGAGPADILFVTPTGQIALVETKLWRNAEARRTVLAQVLDYAKQLSTWSFDDLDREAASASKMGPGYLLERVRQAAPNLDTPQFIDGVNHSLQSGDFLLLIVGDGIRSGAENLVGFIQQYGSLRFHIGLIEAAAYRLDGERVLLQPRVLARTEVITRTVIVGANNQPVQEIAPEPDEPPNSTANQAVWYQGFWSDFSKALTLDDATQPLPQKLPRSTNYYLSQVPSGAMAWISAYLAMSQSKAGVYLSFAKAYERSKETYDLLLMQKEDIERSIGFVLNWERDPDDGKIWISVPSVVFTTLELPNERQRVVTQLADLTNRMVNAFRHRLATIERQLSQ